jgi:ubiquinone/menaquinone biosynthesis C-methylase UbiE
MDLLVPQTPFTSVAPSYDEVFTRLGQTESQRRRIQALMLREWSPGERILDLGCGTGEDIRFLAQQGFTVTGIDPAIGMLEVARLKLNRSSVHAELLCLSAEDLTVFPSESFSGILSNFGAVNTVSDFPRMLSQCARILRPGGSVIFCFLSRWCMGETAGFLLKGKMRQAFRRLHPNPVMVQVGNGLVPTYYRSFRTVRRCVKPWFDMDEVFGLSVVSPPPAWDGFVRRHPRLALELARLDLKAGTMRGIRAIGDHCVVVLRKRIA